MNSFINLAKERYSVRGYKPLPIPPEKLEHILEAGRDAPTACNSQPQRIKIITDPADLAKLDQCTPYRFGAPAVLLVCYDSTVCWKRGFDGHLSGDVDASIVTTHLMLAAWEQGLGSCWVMYFDPAKTSKLLALPENIVPVAMLPLGYPSDSAKPSKNHTNRLALKDMLL